jgi:hypothetical protein
LIPLLALALWPFPTGIKSVACHERSSAPYSDNCQVELSDTDPSHDHTVVLAYSDGTARTVTFKGRGVFVPIDQGKQPASVRLWGKRAVRVKP